MDYQQQKKEMNDISLCIVVMNRTDDLRQSLPLTIKAANASPPVEIVILNYDSKDDLDDYIQRVRITEHFASGVTLKYVKSNNHKFFNISHSRNLSVLAASGSYIVIQDADILPHENFVQMIRENIEKYHPVWMIEHGGHIDEEHIGGRLLVCQKAEFVAAGGYDERFNLCGPEDKDITMRLYRRGGKMVLYSSKVIDEIRTIQKRKIENLDYQKYRDALPPEEPHKLQMTKLSMQRAMRVIYHENCEKGVLVANEGVAWGQ